MNRILLTAVLALVPLAAFAGAPEHADPDVQKVHREIAALKLDKSLNLSREQAQALLPILEQADRLKADMHAERKKQKPEILRAMEQAREELRRDGKVSPATRQAMRQARSGPGHDALRDRAKELIKQAQTVLTPEQRQVVQTFNPREGGADEAHAGPRHGKQRRGGKGLALKVALSPEFRELLKARAR
ncbi:MAG: hypothetical protein ACK4N5_08170 [Myxococcales bacterium]